MGTIKFKDEWMLRAVAGIKGADGAFLEKAKATDKQFISEALLDGKVLTEEQLGKLGETVFKAKYFRLTPESVDKFGLSLLGEKSCRKYFLVPVGTDESDIRVAMANPSDFDAIADLEALTARRVIPLFALPHLVDACLTQLFSSDKVVFDLLSKVEVPDDIEILSGAGGADSSSADISSPVIKLVNSIISQAYRKRASDIHIEHEEKGSHVRFRVDGTLKTILTLPRNLATGPLVSRIKIMGGMDISNRLRPQDGRAKLRIGTAEVGLRVSSLPTSFGEKVVIRILDQRAAEVPFEQLGFAPQVVQALDKCLASPQGIVLVTGPTGSGKTTSLYSMLNKCKSEGTNIVTVEDPVEYKISGVNQVQVNEKQGLSFSSVLRSVLRQDPDMILVGEIRDRETADIALQAAMTGHLVLSTLHTNDAVSTVARLLDIGVDRFKISPALLAVTAQRLVRRLCPLCAQKLPEAACDRSILAAMAAGGLEKVMYKATGCKNCDGTGYAGRTSIVELLTVDAKVRELINSGATGDAITAGALAAGSLRTMTFDALWQLSQGRTDLGEVAPYLSLGKAAPAAAPEAKAPAAVTPPQPAQAGDKPVIMVAEDDAIMRMLLKKFLESAGFSVREAVDGEAALTAIAESTPDLLVSDINMPRLNGLDLVKGVRQNLGLTELPIIMLTTESSDKSQEIAFNLGADDYVIKPFKAPLVVARITAALRRAGRMA